MIKLILRQIETFYCIRGNIVKIILDIHDVEVVVYAGIKNIDYFLKLINWNVLIIIHIALPLHRPETIPFSYRFFFHLQQKNVTYYMENYSITKVQIQQNCN
jgi:hypothetical protein